MKLKGDIVDRLRQALGGKTPTPKRIEKFLDEIEQIKAAKPGEAAPVSPDNEREVTRLIQEKFEQAGRDLVARQTPDVGSPTPAETAFIPPGPDEEEDNDEPEVPPAAVIDPDEDPKVRAIREAAERREAMLMASIKNMEARITELAKARLPEEKEAAVGAGKLPVGGPVAGPVGFTGAADLPRGRWFRSPFGPPIDMMLCGCEECLPHRMQHYYCVMCKRGPFDYDPSRGGKAPGGRKVWLAPGSTWGISHETCTATCFQRYMEEVQVVLAQRGQTGASGKIPPKPALVPGSD